LIERRCPGTIPTTAARRVSLHLHRCLALIYVVKLLAFERPFE
jgi:hypothetical protein